MTTTDRKPRKKINLGIVILVEVIIILVLGGWIVYKSGSLFPRFLRSKAVTEPLVVTSRVSGDAPEFWDVLEGQPVTKAQLQETEESFQLLVENRNEELLAAVLEAEGYYLVDDTGQVITSKHPYDRRYPASMTKLLTAILAIENTEDLDALITVQELTGCYEEGSVIMFLEPEERISMRDLLHGLLMCSYNDTATAIAMEIGGSLEEFARMMNHRAAELGLKNSHFVNPHGLHTKEHFSCPYDMTLLLQKAMSMPEIVEIMTTPTWEAEVYVGEDEQYTVDLYNGNYFVRGVYRVPGLTYLGGKTGYEQAARSCFASCFTDGTHTYYLTVMKALDAPYMTALLLDYYFAPYSLLAHATTEPWMKEWQLEYEADYEED